MSSKQLLQINNSFWLSSAKIILSTLVLCDEVVMTTKIKALLFENTPQTLQQSQALDQQEPPSSIFDNTPCPDAHYSEHAQQAPVTTQFEFLADFTGVFFAGHPEIRGQDNRETAHEDNFTVKQGHPVSLKLIGKIVRAHGKTHGIEIDT